MRLAQLRGEVEALFPQRPIHFADWMDTLPPQKRWQALPIRELYVDDGNLITSAGTADRVLGTCPDAGSVATSPTARNLHGKPATVTPAR